MAVGARHGAVWSVVVWRGLVWQACRGMSGWGAVGCGLARYGRRGESWIGLVRCGEVRYGRRGVVRRVEVWSVKER